MLCVDKLDNEKRQKTRSASGIGRAASCPCAAESSVVIHQSAKIGQKDRWGECASSWHHILVQ